MPGQRVWAALLPARPRPCRRVPAPPRPRFACRLRDAALCAGSGASCASDAARSGHWARGRQTRRAGRENVPQVWGRGVGPGAGRGRGPAPPAARGGLGSCDSDHCEVAALERVADVGCDACVSSFEETQRVTAVTAVACSLQKLRRLGRRGWLTGTSPRSPARRAFRQRGPVCPGRAWRARSLRAVPSLVPGPTPRRCRL